MMKPDMMKPDRIFAITAMIAAPLILSIALIACDNPGAKKAAEDEAAATEAAAMVFAVNTTTATRGQIRDYLLLSGDIVSGSTVDAYSDVAGDSKEQWSVSADRSRLRLTVHRFLS